MTEGRKENYYKNLPDDDNNLTFFNLPFFGRSYSPMCICHPGRNPSQTLIFLQKRIRSQRHVLVRGVPKRWYSFQQDLKRREGKTKEDHNGDVCGRYRRGAMCTKSGNTQVVWTKTHSITNSLQHLPSTPGGWLVGWFQLENDFSVLVFA